MMMIRATCLHVLEMGRAQSDPIVAFIPSIKSPAALHGVMYMYLLFQLKVLNLILYYYLKHYSINFSKI